MRALSSLDSIAFADLLDLCREADLAAPYPANGSVVTQTRSGRDYWSLIRGDQTVAGRLKPHAP